MRPNVNLLAMFHWSFGKFAWCADGEGGYWWTNGALMERHERLPELPESTRRVVVPESIDLARYVAHLPETPEEAIPFKPVVPTVQRVPYQVDVPGYGSVVYGARLYNRLYLRWEKLRWEGGQMGVRDPGENRRSSDAWLCLFNETGKAVAAALNMIVVTPGMIGRSG